MTALDNSARDCGLDDQVDARTKNTSIIDISNDGRKNVHDFKNHFSTRTPASLPGGHSVGVPPDPIPNSAVKPDCADGTIAQAMEE
jgi:hypothetical protein